MEIQDIGNYQYLMHGRTALPDIHFLHLMVIANGHSFSSCVAIIAVPQIAAAVAATIAMRGALQTPFQ